ncbi:hypothetical protein Aduo_011951 [Ancylostoma duodenale]
MEGGDTQERVNLVASISSQGAEGMGPVISERVAKNFKERKKNRIDIIIVSESTYPTTSRIKSTRHTAEQMGTRSGSSGRRSIGR